MSLEFSVLATSGPARRGRLKLAHGVIQTPAFMPVGTYGAVKGMRPQQVEDSGADVILGKLSICGFGLVWMLSKLMEVCTVLLVGTSQF